MAWHPIAWNPICTTQPVGGVVLDAAWYWRVQCESCGGRHEVCGSVCLHGWHCITQSGCLGVTLCGGGVHERGLSSALRGCRHQAVRERRCRCCAAFRGRLGATGHRHRHVQCSCPAATHTFQACDHLLRTRLGAAVDGYTDVCAGQVVAYASRRELQHHWHQLLFWAERGRSHAARLLLVGLAWAGFGLVRLYHTRVRCTSDLVVVCLQVAGRTT
jgi:hypothetical protein